MQTDIINYIRLQKKLIQLRLKQEQYLNEKIEYEKNNNLIKANEINKKIKAIISALKKEYDAKFEIHGLTTLLYIDGRGYNPVCFDIPLSKDEEIAQLKEQLEEWKDKASNCNRIAADNFKIASDLMEDKEKLESALKDSRCGSDKLFKLLQR